MTDNAANMKKAFRSTMSIWDEPEISNEYVDIQMNNIIIPGWLQAEVEEEPNFFEEEDLDFELFQIELGDIIEQSWDSNRVSYQSGCIAHTLQLVVRDGLASLSVILYI